MSAVKEPFVFATERFRQRLGEYAGMLDPAAAARGESSTVYSQYPHFGDVPARIAATVPRASFVYVVRDPVERALAHYRQRWANGDEDRPPGVAFADYGEPASVYLAASRYATQLRLFLARFPAERFLVVDQADLRERRGATLTRIFSFVGVEPGATRVLPERHLNTAEDLRVATAAGRRLGDSGLVRAGRRLPLPGPVRRLARDALSRRVPSPQLEPELRERIAASLRDEVAWLREFAGETFAGWST